MNDSKDEDFENPIENNSDNENKENPKRNSNIKDKEIDSNNENKDIDNENKNNENNTSEFEQIKEFNKKNEPSNSEINILRNNEDNKNEGINKTNNNDENDINIDINNEEEKEDNNYNIKNINYERRYMNNINDNIKQNNLNEDEKIDDNYNFENDDMRLSNIKNNELNRNSNENNSNEPSGFIYDVEDDNQNEGQENVTKNDLKINKNGNTNYNNTKGNDFDSDNNNQNNLNNRKSINNRDSNTENNQNKSQKNSINYNQYYNNSNDNYASNPYINNNYMTSGPSKESQNFQNQTNANFIPQDIPIISSLNDNTYNISENKKNNSEYDPQFEQYEEFQEDGDGQSIDPNKKGKDSTKTAGAQIANTIMGAGILSIPIIMRYLGIIFGTLLIIFLALTTIYSVYILIKCHKITGKNGYSMFGKITMGKFGSILVKIIIIINNLGLCIAYFRIFGEVVQTIIQAWASSKSFWIVNWHNFFYILICGVIMICFIFIKNISSLKKVAYLGVLAVLIFSISLLILLIYKKSSKYLDSGMSWKFLFPNCTITEAFKAVPTVFLAFLFQFNVFPIYQSLRNRNMKSMMKAANIGIGFSFIIFLIVGIIGFLLYGLSMEDTILNSFSDDMVKYRSVSTFIKILIIIICISFVTTCLTSFPILFLSLRENFINFILFCYKNSGIEKISEGKNDKNNKYKYISKNTMYLITILLYLLILALSIVMPKLKVIFSIVGATAGTFIAFILPNLFYIRICKMSGKKYSIVLPLILLAFGIFFLIVSIVVTFI